MEFESILTLFRDSFNYLVDFHSRSSNQIYGFYAARSREILDMMHIMFKSSFNILMFSTMIIALFYVGMSIAVYFRKKKMKTIGQNDYFPQVTIQIPTFNELAAITCAQKCIAFDYPRDNMQIIIGDDSNNKEISAKILEFQNEVEKICPGLLHITRRSNNVGYKPGNLNNMLRYTKGEFIVIFDSDFIPEKDFLRRIVYPFKDNSDLSVVQARWKVINFDQNIVSVLAGSVSVMFHHMLLPFTQMLKGTPILCGSAEAIRKSDLIEVGGWREGSMTEDVECTFRLIKHHKKLVYLEDLECACEVPHTPNDLFKQQMRWAYGIIASLKLHYGGILKDGSIKLIDKISLFIITGLGYLFSFSLFLITILGIFSVITETPGPIDWIRFVTETGINILITSGFILATALSLLMNKHSDKIPHVLLSSFTVGLAVTYYVNKGILKAFFGRSMHWFMLKKNANFSVQPTRDYNQ